MMISKRGVTTTSIVVLVLFFTSLVSAGSIQVANVTFHVVYRCEHPCTYADLDCISMSLSDSPCRYKEINTTEMNESFHSWVDNWKNITVEAEKWNEDPVYIRPCHRDHVYLKTKNPDLEIYYDGTWLIFEKKTGSFWIDSMEFNRIKDRLKEDITKLIEENKNNVYRRRSQKITTITRITSFKLANKTLNDLTPSDVSAVCGYPDLSHKERDFHLFYDPGGGLRHISKDICLISDEEGLDFPTWYIGLFKYLDWLWDCNKKYEEEVYRWGRFQRDSRWSFTVNITNLREELKKSYEEVCWNETIDNLQKFLDNDSKIFSEEIDRLNNERDDRVAYAKVLNEEVLSRSMRKKHYSNLTYPLFRRYYEDFMELNEKADSEIDYLENDYNSKIGDIRSRYNLLILTNQTKALQTMIEDSRNQFNDNFIIQMVVIAIVGITLVVTIYFEWNAKKSNEKLIKIIGNLPQSIKDLQEPRVCLIEGLLKRIFEK